MVTRIFALILFCFSHLDHCGGLPYFTEMCGYNGPILMTVLKEFDGYSSSYFFFIVPYERYLSYFIGRF